MSSRLINRWIVRRQINEAAKLRMFCFPYAGGSATIYNDWYKYSHNIEVCAIQYPGHGNRLLETPINNLSTLVKKIKEVIRCYLDKPFVFFGHSLGALVAYELTRELRRENKQCPEILFISAFRAPHLPFKRNELHKLPDNDLLESLRQMNGTPEVILRDQEMMDLMLPMIRADLEVSETYSYVQEHPLNIPITVFGGIEDSSIAYEALEAWGMHTDQRFRLISFRGDHFFLHNNGEHMFKVINEDIAPLIMKDNKIH